MILSRDSILQADDLPRETVAVPEWGGSVIIATLTGFERDAYEASATQTVNGQLQMVKENFRARLLALCIVDEEGRRLFSDRDVAALGKKSAAVIARLWQIAAQLNGITKRDVDELEKNSGSDQSDDSGSG